MKVVLAFAMTGESAISLQPRKIVKMRYHLTQWLAPAWAVLLQNFEGPTLRSNLIPVEPSNPPGEPLL